MSQTVSHCATIFAIWLLRPNHHTDCCARDLHLDIPICPSCSRINISVCIPSGMTTVWPFIKRPFAMCSSLWWTQKGFLSFLAPPVLVTLFCIALSAPCRVFVTSLQHTTNYRRKTVKRLFCPRVCSVTFLRSYKIKNILVCTYHKAVQRFTLKPDHCAVKFK